MIENNIQPTILISDVFRNVSDKILFNLNFLIGKIMEYKISIIYSYNYIEFLDNFIKLFNERYKYSVKYEIIKDNKKISKKTKKTNITKENTLFYINYEDFDNKKKYMDVILNFKYVYLPAELATFFYGFYVKEYYEDYYLLKENIHLKNGPLNEK